MHRFIGRKKEKKPAATLEQGQDKLDKRGDSIDLKIKKLEAELIDYKNKMKRARGATKASLKRRAMQVLKRKKMYEKQRDNLAAQSFNLEQTSFTIDSLKATADTVETMKESAKVLKKQYKAIKIDKVEDLQDDLADLMFDAEEIQEVMGRSYGVPDEVDEDDLMDELEALGDELEEDELEGEPDYLKSSELPSAPDGQVEASGADEFGLPAQAVAN